MTRTIHCFFSGGRDSAVACYIAKRVADVRNWRFVLVHINTTISIRQTREYVRQYAKWLEVELIELHPKKTFKEYAAQYGMWPSLYPTQYRWCYFCLKLDPTVEYLKEFYRQGDLVALGVRGSESRFRLGRYTSAFFVRDYDTRLKALAWAPLWKATSDLVERLIKQFNITRNPVWRFGSSGECLCLAGMPIHKVALILRYFPEETRELLEIDRIINKNRRSNKPSAPFRVWQAGYNTLEEFYDRVVKTQMTLDDFFAPYESCEGACML
jgi:3'-phosphoadenosine 5'-phosphosulfate sulfotransferase (PAPS reductase)/FAD synthetase